MKEEEGRKEEGKEDVPLEIEEEAQPILPPSVDQLVGETIAALPELSLHQQPLETILTIFATYVGAPEIPVLLVDRETALLELELTHGWSAESIDGACNRVIESLADVIEQLQVDFEEATDTLTAGVDFEDFAHRFTDERQEQAGLVNQAKKLLESVKVVSGQLGIPNPDPGLQPGKEVKKETFVTKAGTALLATGKKVVSPFIILPGRKEEAEELPPPSWKTEPVLRDDDRDFKLLELVQTRLSGEPDISLVWITLERLNLERERLTELLAQVAGKARQQLAQSKEILQNVAMDYQQFSGRLESVQDVQQIVLQVHDFFFPKESEATTP